MKVIVILLITLICLNLTALSQSRSMQSSTKLRDNFSNRISTLGKSEPFTKAISTNYEIEPQEILNVYNHNGSVKIIGWNKDFVKITAIKKSFKRCCDLSRILMVLKTLQGLSIETVNTSDDQNAHIDYIINVPQNIVIGEIHSKSEVKFKNLPISVVENFRRLATR